MGSLLSSTTYVNTYEGSHQHTPTEAEVAWNIKQACIKEDGKQEGCEVLNQVSLGFGIGFFRL